MKKQLALIVLLGMAATLLFGCTGQNETGTVRSSNQQLVVSLNGEPQNLDPALWPTVEESTLGITFFEGLLRLGKDGQAEAGAADRWEMSSDGLTYTFHIREDAKWSDGEPVTAKDFEFAWLRVLDPETNATNVSLLEPIKNAMNYNQGKAKQEDVGIRAVDDSTLEVILEEPTPYFLDLLPGLTFAPVRSDIIEKVPLTWSTKAQLLITNGAFRITRWEHKYLIEAEPNPYYWDEASIKLAKLVFKLDGSVQGKYADFQDGIVDIGTAFPKELDIDQQIKENKVVSNAFLGTGYLQFNTLREPFDDVRVRKALGLVIDKNAIAQIRHAGEKPAGGVVPPGMPDADPQVDFRETGGNLQPIEQTADQIAEAKELLAEAGYPEGKGLPTVSYLGNIAYAEVLKENFALIGVELSFHQETGAVYWDRFGRGDYDLLEFGWIADYSDPYTFLGTFADSSFIEIDPTFREKLDAANAIVDTKQRFTVLHEAEEILLESYAVIPLLYKVDNYYVQPYVKDYYRTVRSEPIYRYVTIDEALKHELLQDK